MARTPLSPAASGGRLTAPGSATAPGRLDPSPVLPGNRLDPPDTPLPVGGRLDPPAAPSPAPRFPSDSSPPVLPKPDPDAVAKELAERNVFEALQALFKQYGLDLYDSKTGAYRNLSDLLMDYVKQGYDKDTIGLLIQNSEQWKQRFSGNELRKQQGKAVLSPAEYLATERAYAQAAQAYGLPKEFYDKPDDFAKLIGNDISPDEFSKRASYASKYVAAQDPTARNLLQQYYGVDQSHLVAHFLDPDQAVSLLDRRAKAVDLGVVAHQNGLNLGLTSAERYTEMGIDADTAQRNAQQLVGSGYDAGTEQTIARRFGDAYGVQDQQDEMIAGLASAKRKRELLNSREAALFQQGGGGVQQFGNDNSGGF